MNSKYDTQKLKKVEVEVLDYFVSKCKKNNLKYFLAYGTLLGAVRHGGFIPWDDDIDVYMLPEDYYKFKDIMIKEKNEDFFFQSLETEKYYNLIFDKIRMNNTEAIEFKTKNEPIHKGIYIDIFPLIPFPTDKKEQQRMWKNHKIVNLLIEADLKDKTMYNNYGKLGKILSKLFKIVPRNIRNIIASSKLKKIITYNGDFEKYVCLIDKKYFDKKFFEKTTLISFESKKYACPKEYDKYLTSIYGDYMKLPKKEDRKGHSFLSVKFKNEE